MNMSGFAKKRLKKISKRQAAIKNAFRVLAKQVLLEEPKCQRCRTRESTDPHHLVPRSVGPKLILERSNIISLCRQCHDWVRDNPKEAYASGFLKRSTDWDYQTGKFK